VGSASAAAEQWDLPYSDHAVSPSLIPSGLLFFVGFCWCVLRP
jgi:hypothetical protein